MTLNIALRFSISYSSTSVDLKYEVEGAKVRCQMNESNTCHKKN